MYFLCLVVVVVVVPSVLLVVVVIGFVVWVAVVYLLAVCIGCVLR